MKTFAAIATISFCAASGFAATNWIAYGGASFTFRPNNITINAGDTVIWTNAGGAHNVVGDTPGTALCGCAGSSIGAFTNVFNAPADYLYHCSFHQSIGMTGVVHVASTAAPMLNSVAKSFTNGFVFVVTNTANHTNIIQASTNLANPGAWISLATNFPGTNSFNFADTNTAAFSNRFYRVTQF